MATPSIFDILSDIIDVPPVSGDITNQSGSDTTNIYNQPGAGKVVIAGDGTALSGNNSFTGGIKITGGHPRSRVGARGRLRCHPVRCRRATPRSIRAFIEQSGTYFNNTLVLHGTDDPGTTPETVTLDMPGLSPSNFLVQVANGSTTVSYGNGEHDIVAYCPGTLIETREGARGIEQLAIADEVVTASGALRPIK